MADPTPAPEQHAAPLSAESVSAAPAPSSAKARQRRSAWHWAWRLPLALLVLLALVLAAAGGAAYWAWRHEASLPWVLQRVPGLTAQGVTGTLQSGQLRIVSMDYRLPAGAGRLQISGLRIDGPSLRLWPRPGAQLRLHLSAVSADRVVFTSGPPSGQPLQAPADVRLPLDLAIDRLAITEMRIDALPPVHALTAALALGADGGRRHQLTGASLTVDVGSAEAPAPLQVQADLDLGTDAPLPLQARLAVQRLATPAWQATLQASGPLARLATEARLTGEARGQAAAPAVQVKATVLPFAGWPLAALQLQTEALDLAALSPQLPSTRLSGSAEVLTTGLDQPATVVASLDNALPGAWDAGRLPLQKLHLKASGAPNQHDRLTLEQFELQLGDAPGGAGAAGRISGQGRWLADTLALDLRLDDLRPARLHRRAAALSLGGPLQLRASGLPVPQAAAGTALATGSAALATGAASTAASATAATAATARPSPARPAPAAPPLQLAIDTQLTGRLLDGTGVPVKLVLKGDASARHLRLRQAEAVAGAAKAQGTLDAQAEATGWHLRGQLALTDFDPRPWWRGAEKSAWRRGPHRLGATLIADVHWRRDASRTLAADTLALDRLLAAVDGDASLAIADSLLAGVPLAGQIKLHSAGPTASVDGRIDLAGNQLTLAGQGGGAPAADEWRLGLQAPALAALAPLGQMLAEWSPAAAKAWPQAGALNGALKTNGRWPAMRTQGGLQASGLHNGMGALHSATLDWRTGGDADAPLAVKLLAQGVSRGTQRLDRLQAEITGSLRDHGLHLLADSPARPPAWAESLLGPAGSGTRFEADARGQWTAPAGSVPGLYRVQAMALKGGALNALGGSRPWLAAQGLAGALQLNAAGQVASVQVEPGRVQLLSTALNWRELRWQADAAAGPRGRLDVAAELETIDVARLLARFQPDVGWGGNLTIGGRIDIHSAARFDADLVLSRGIGDLTVTDDLGVTQALGLTDLRLALTAHDGLWQFAQGLAGRRLGTLAGAQVLQTTPERRWPAANAALQGVLEARVADLGVWGAWVPPGWRLSGQLDTVAQLGGTLGAPEITGTMRGAKLGVRNLLQGVSLTDGQLALVLQGDDARIEQLSFKGGDGELRVTGGAVLGAKPRATLRVVADKFRALGRIDRRVIASGSADLVLDAERLQLDGAITVDEGLVDMGRAGTPALDDDVIVSRSAPAGTVKANGANGASGANGAAAAAAPPPVRNAQVNVKVGLGRNLRLRGYGVDTLLRGDLVLASPGGRLALNGTVRTQDGRYAAYGQKLEITRGDFTFIGPIDNPRLDVLAIRPDLDVLVGVTIIGNASNPRIRLYSEPDLPDYDKLSWLVMGRAPDGLGSADAALLQSAAFALLSGDGKGPTDQLISAIGLTDLSVRQTEGDTRDTIISLGKQLSRRWYVGYERGVHATTGTWQVIYRVAQRFTLRAQSGEETALDVIWTWRW